MNGILWIVQILLGLLFVITGITKLIEPLEKMAERWVWVSDFPLPAIRAIGIIETLGAIGIVAPALTGILPWLTPIAACGLLALMLGALATNFRHKLYPQIGLSLVLIAQAAFVAYGRFMILPL